MIYSAIEDEVPVDPIQMLMQKVGNNYVLLAKHKILYCYGIQCPIFICFYFLDLKRYR